MGIQWRGHLSVLAAANFVDVSRQRRQKGGIWGKAVTHKLPTGSEVSWDGAPAARAILCNSVGHCSEYSLPKIFYTDQLICLIILRSQIRL